MKQKLLMLAILMVAVKVGPAADYTACFQDFSGCWVEVAIKPENRRELTETFVLRPYQTSDPVQLDDFQKRPKIKEKKKKGKIVKKTKEYDRAPIVVELFFFSDSSLTRFVGYRRLKSIVLPGKEKKFVVRAAPKKRALAISWLKVKNVTARPVYFPTFWDKGADYLIQPQAEQTIGVIKKKDRSIVVRASVADQSGLFREHQLKLTLPDSLAELVISEDYLREQLGLWGLLYNPSRKEWVRVEYGRNNQQVVLAPLGQKLISILPGEQIKFRAHYYQDEQLTIKGSNAKWLWTKIANKPKIRNIRGQQVAFCINL